MSRSDAHLKRGDLWAWVEQWEQSEDPPDSHRGMVLMLLDPESLGCWGTMSPSSARNNPSSYQPYSSTHVPVGRGPRKNP